MPKTEPQPVASTPDVVACGTVDELRQVLAKYHERPLWSGLDENGHPLLLFGEEHGRSWTLGRLMGPRLICIVSTGTHSEPTAYPDPSHSA